MTLPAPLTDALRWPESGSGPPWWAWVVALMVLVWLWRYWRRRRAVAAPPSAIDAPPPTRRRGGLLDALEQLVEEVRESRDYRAGCHAVAQLLRDHLSGLWRRPLATATHREVVRKMLDAKEEDWRHVLEELDGLQFQRREPGSRDFEDVTYALARAASRRPDPAERRS